MLDAFIIDRIRRERERRDATRTPLRVEVPAASPDEPDRRHGGIPADPERGTTIIEDASIEDATEDLL